MARDAVPPGWGRVVSRGCCPGPECLPEDREGRARAGATSQQEDRQMQSRCLIISTAFSDPWKSLHPNVDILREHTLLLRAGAITRCPQAGRRTFPWTVYRRGWCGLPLLWMEHPWGWSWAGESHQELCAALGDEALLQARSRGGMALCPSCCIPLCRDVQGGSSWPLCPARSLAKHKGRQGLETALSLHPSPLTAGPYWPRQLVDIS